MALVLAEPLFQIEVVELLAPQHAGQRLTVDTPLVFVQRWGRDSGVELVASPRRAANAWSKSLNERRQVRRR